MQKTIRLCPAENDPDFFIQLANHRHDALKRERRKAAVRRAQARQDRREAAVAIMVAIAAVAAVVGWGTIVLTPWG